MSANTRSHEVAAVLRTEILREQYRIGERLPSERDLAARFDTNRGAIREALKQLEQLGIIDIQPGGVRVKPVAEASLELLGYLLNLDGYPNPKLIDDYLQVFSVFCVMSAKTSIALADEAQLAFIANTIARMKTDPADRELMREGWTELFEFFMAVNDNLVMRLISNGLKGQFLAQMTSFDPKPALDEKVMRKVLNGMARSVKNRDAEQMGEFVGRYFEWVRNVVAKAFNDYQFTSQQAVGSQ